MAPTRGHRQRATAPISVLRDLLPLTRLQQTRRSLIIRA